MKRYLRNEAFVVEDHGCYISGIVNNSNDGDTTSNELIILFPDSEGDIELVEWGTVGSNPGDNDKEIPGYDQFIVDRTNVDAVGEETPPSVFVNGKEFIINNYLGPNGYIVHTFTPFVYGDLTIGETVYVPRNRDDAAALFFDSNSLNMSIGEGIYLPQGTQIFAVGDGLTIFFNWSNPHSSGNI